MFRILFNSECKGNRFSSKEKSLKKRKYINSNKTYYLLIEIRCQMSEREAKKQTYCFWISLLFSEILRLNINILQCKQKYTAIKYKQSGRQPKNWKVDNFYKIPKTQDRPHKRIIRNLRRLLADVKNNPVEREKHIENILLALPRGSRPARTNDDDD